MRNTKIILVPVAAIGLLSAILAGCTTNSDISSTPSATSTASPVTNTTQTTPASQQPIAEKPVAAEKNPPGDIPDNQVFVTYKSASAGYQLEVPEGWARQTNADNVKFTDKLNTEEVTVKNEPNPLNAATVKTKQVVELQKTGRAVQVTNVKDVQLPSGKAVLIEYTSNSEPDTVTGKQIRQENNSYLFYKNGKLATLTLSAPQGADNVDQWQRISRSFRW